MYIKKLPIYTTRANKPKSNKNTNPNETFIENFK